MGDQDDGVDPRYEFLNNYLSRSLKLKAEKWTKMINTEEFVQVIEQFFKKEEIPFMIIYVNIGGFLNPTLTIPNNSKQKMPYFIRKAPEPITTKNFRTILLIGEMSPKPIDEMTCILNHICAPLVQNKENVTSWPDVTINDVLQHLHKINSCVEEVQAAMTGQIILPMPYKVDDVLELEHELQRASMDYDLNLKIAIEDIVIKWSYIINLLLSEEPTITFSFQNQPSPSEEIKFWLNRYRNLQSIYCQLADPRVKKMASILEITHSVYFPAFKTLFKTVLAALKEADDISLYLKPAQKQYDAFESSDFLEVKPIIRPMLHVTCLVWGNCKYYYSAKRIIVLLREVNNMVITECSKSLEPTGILQGEVLEGYLRVEGALYNLKYYKEVFEEFRGKLDSFYRTPDYTPPIGWTFHPNEVFYRLDVYIERLELIKYLLETAIEYYRLEKVEIAGIGGKILSYKVTDIATDFNRHFGILAGLTYDPLEPENDQFIKEFKVFNRESGDLDRRLACVFQQALDEVCHLGGLLKLYYIMGGFPERKIIKAQIGDRCHALVDLLESELDMVKIIFDEGKQLYDKKGVNGMPVDMWFPPVAGTVMWINKLRKRIQIPFEEFINIEQKVLETENGKYVTRKYNEMIDLLDGMQKEILDKFSEQAPIDEAETIVMNLLVRDEDGLLVLNFDPRLQALLKELRLLNQLGIPDLPAEHLLEENDRMQYQAAFLSRVVDWYNYMKTKTVPVEFDLIRAEMDAIDEQLNQAVDTLTWQEDNSEFVQQNYETLSLLSIRVLRAQKALRDIIDEIREWGDIPLFHRKKMNPKSLINIDDYEERIKRRYQDIRDTAEDLADTMELNYMLYMGIPVPTVEEMEAMEEAAELARIAEQDAREAAAALAAAEAILAQQAAEMAALMEEEKREAEAAAAVAEKAKAAKRKQEEAEQQARVLATQEIHLDEYPGEGFEEPGLGDRIDQEGTIADEQEPVEEQFIQIDFEPEITDLTLGDEELEEEEPEAAIGKEEYEDDEGEEEEEVGRKRKRRVKIPIHEYTEEELAREPENRERYKPYQEYVDELVANELMRAVNFSVKYIVTEMTDVPGLWPFFRMEMQLAEPDIVFVPSLDGNDEKGFFAQMEDILQDICNMVMLIPRVARHYDEPFYEYELENNQRVFDMHYDIAVKTEDALRKAADHESEMEIYAYLWENDRGEFLEQFKRYGHYLTHEELDIKELGLEELKEIPPTLHQYKEKIDYYSDLRDAIDKEIKEELILDSWLLVDCRPFKQAVLNHICKWGNMFKQNRVDFVINSLNELQDFIAMANVELIVEVKPGQLQELLKVMEVLNLMKNREYDTDNMFEPIKAIMEMVAEYGVTFDDEVYDQLNDLPEEWNKLKKIAMTTRQNIAPLQTAEVNLIKKRLALFDLQQSVYRKNFKKLAIHDSECENPYVILDKANVEIEQFEIQMENLISSAVLFELNIPEFKGIKKTRKEVVMLKSLWDLFLIIAYTIEDWKTTPWAKINVEDMDMECKKFGKDLRGLDKELRFFEPYTTIESRIKNLMTSLRAVTELQNPAIRERHWLELMQETKVAFVMSDETTLADLLDLNLYKFEEEVKTIVDKSVKEMAMEKTLVDLKATWSVLEFETEKHERTGLNLLKVSEELVEILEDNQGQLQNLMTSKFIGHFLTEFTEWQRKLSNADQVISNWVEVQRKWQYLESIFIGSEDIRSQLPEDSKRFDRIDREFKEILQDVLKTPNVIQGTDKHGLSDHLEDLMTDLIKCEKALNDYLETKRLCYPRFYFVSSSDLLDILSNGNNPLMVGKHLTKLYDNLAVLIMSQGKMSKAMISKENEEYVAFKNECDCSGKVEVWLNRVTDSMRDTLHDLFGKSVHVYEDKPRDMWLFDWPAQVSLCGTQIWWTTEVDIAFGRLEEGYENALKDYQRKQINQLNALIVLLCGDLTQGDRQKIMTICTIDVHSRDVVAKMIIARIDSKLSFQWVSQLRHRWDDKDNDCFANICDAQFRYDYEYLGNTPRLVITPLTDRCYITLTQSLHLIMGGAPAGPAGTGKTETTKDLGRALGVMVYVFNCSEQMDYKSCESIYKGLAQCGAWGCFDEFNRISVEVLSVIAVQVKTIQDAIKTKKQIFNFMGNRIVLVPTVGLFITMNPGYAGRAELPENLKALFRPCAMVVPDFELIAEIMLVAEGFQEARVLARKFLTLYTLCKELLSKQDHYDWGLRAIKSVLVVAGALKRGDRTRPEDQVLMRALRDFNIPKIVTDDVPVFMGLIGDLFPALDVPRKRNPDFEKMIRNTSAEYKLQSEDGFVLKIVQLEELFAVRHSVFIIGFAGTGKSCVWKMLNRTYYNMGTKPLFVDLNPKAVTNNELFGIINPATREWKDGLFSVIMRDMALLTGGGAKWIVFDGDIDPMWIESLNTVMDDNKVLTLASNERIALTPKMRLLFEISNLRTATPATVSRAGILYINPADLGWSPYVLSWIETRSNQSEKATLIILFDKYIPPCLDCMKKVKKITPIVEVAQIQMVCYLLDYFLTPQNLPSDCPKDWLEIYFAFCVIWGFGSALFQDQLCDWRNEFNKWWTNEFKTVRFPNAATIFHYFIDPDTKKFLPWTELVKSHEFDPDIPLQSYLVPTAETMRLKFFVDIFMEKKVPVMLVGGAGTGKSVIIADKLGHLGALYAVTNVPFNFYTTSEMLQRILERVLEKKAGRNYGPPGNKTMVYFVDDMNMPEVDAYGTVQPHTLIRQFFDYGHWYDRLKLSLKDIHNCQYVSCMNPTAGSFVIDPRLQRHFCVFAMSFPADDALYSIYSQILQQHCQAPSHKFNPIVTKVVPQLVASAISLHTKTASSFLPTAVKFHYIFNVRDLANTFQGMLFANGDACPNINMFVRLWMHEATRVYGDKLVDHKDQVEFGKIVADIAKKGFEELDDNVVFKLPLIFSHFSESIGDPKYLAMPSWDHLGKLLNEAMSSYNDLVGTMNLVLFEDAASHICRINRILESPRGNALLVGVGGSGKQSLSRLSSFISSLDVFQVQLKKGYGVVDLKLDIASLYMKAGVKVVGSVFLMTDAQVDKEIFLVVINDLLASGDIPDLLSDEEIEVVMGAMRNEVKALGMEETRDNCWHFFIDRVRRTLKVILSFSPVGSTLRVRARKFPALVNCTAIDWFHEWPQDALESVSKRFLSELQPLPVPLINSVSLYMSFVHTIVNYMSGVYLTNERRYNYTTPKSFLELIALYSKILYLKSNALKNRIIALQNGLLKLVQCSEQVAGLKTTLATQEVVLKVKNAAADKLIVVVGAESKKVATEKEFVNEEEKKVRVIEEDVTVKAKICGEDLAKAEPALLAAQEALNTLNKNNLTELKSFGSPPEAAVNVCAAVLVLFAKKGKIPRDRSWKACKLMMGDVNVFLNNLIYYDKENIHPDIIKAVLPYIKDKEFDPVKIMSKSGAAAGLCSWVINIYKFYQVFVLVEPKRRALNDANKELSDARKKLEKLTTQIAFLEEKLKVLTDEFDLALAEKMKCQQEADATAFTIDLANRLVNGLASENVRWKQSVEFLKGSGLTVPGDCLVVCCFVSYVGCFTKVYRTDLLNKYWIPQFEKIRPEIPRTKDLDPLSLLTDDAQIAVWNNEGLPSDRMSAENATILTNSSRWPLIIDPQLQGIKWIKTRYGSALVVLRLTARNYLDKIERAMSNGDTLLLENIYESVDAVLEPLMGRVTIKKGRYMKIGDKEMDFHPNFRLILQTKLANPHYQPEMQAQATLINFTVTRDGLEEQLLAEVVKAERPDLESLKSELTKQQNSFKITLKVLEEDLLERLSSAGANVLEDSALVINLETTKKTAADVEVKAAEAKITSVKIDEAREHYRPAGCRASILYFILNELFKVNMIYQFSLKAFTIVFLKAVHQTAPADTLAQRVLNLLDSISYAIYKYTTRGLFEVDKLIFTAQVVIQIQVVAGEINPAELNFLLKFPAVAANTCPVDFLSTLLWGGVKMLSDYAAFTSLDKDIEGSSNRWKKFVEAEAPEREKFPQEWKNKTSLQRLCMMRTLRPDRMIYATSCYIEENLGVKFTESRTIEFQISFAESSNNIAMFFILSPGVDPLKDVEKHGKKIKYTTDLQNFHIVSLGQGQEPVAEHAIDVASKFGQWVMLQNIHLVEKWLPMLEKKMEGTLDNAHVNYRLFMSAEPAGSPEYHILPQGVLESSIKITNEAPTGMNANLHKALDNFNQDTLEMCSKEAEFKALLFSLCYFHAVVAERRKFGPQGWNRVYPFNVGDLTISVYVLYNYLEANAKVPWEDLRYLFGEIMYGGHITDDWDRKLCRTYLVAYMQPELVDGDLFFASGFPAPPNTDYRGFHEHIDDNLPSESPVLYGLHPNAEIMFLTAKAEKMFKIIFELQPRDAGAGGGGGISKEEKVRALIEDLMDKIPDPFNMQEMMAKIEELTPFIIVALQECERMNILMGELRRSLKELELGLKGELTITKDMEDLQETLFLDAVPDSWSKLAYPSLLNLGGWYNDLQLRLRDLEAWAGDFNLPASVWLGGFFNPQSFLTAIMQQTARKNEWPLDKMCLNCDVTKKQKYEVTSAPREGANVNGLFMEGARWDHGLGGITDAKIKDLFPVMPVVYVKAITQDKQDLRNCYECPVYKIRQRGPTYVWTFNLKSKEKAGKWVMAGVALLLSV